MNAQQYSDNHSSSGAQHLANDPTKTSLETGAFNQINGNRMEIEVHSSTPTQSKRSSSSNVQLPGVRIPSATDPNSLTATPRSLSDQNQVIINLRDVRSIPDPLKTPLPSPRYKLLDQAKLLLLQEIQGQRVIKGQRIIIQFNQEQRLSDMIDQVHLELIKKARV